MPAAAPADIHAHVNTTAAVADGEYLYRADLYRRIQSIVQNPAGTPSTAPDADQYISSDHATVVDAVRVLHCCICSGAKNKKSPPRRRDCHDDRIDYARVDGCSSTATTSSAQVPQLEAARDVSIRAVLMAGEQQGARGCGGLLEELVKLMTATISRDGTALTSDHRYGDDDDTSEATILTMMEVVGALAGASAEAAARCVRAGAVRSLVSGLSAGQPLLTSAAAKRNAEKALSLLLLLASSCPEGRAAGRAHLPALFPALVKQLIRVSDKATASSIALLSLLLLPHHAPPHGGAPASSTDGGDGDHLMINDIKALAASSSLVGKLVLVLQLPPINQSTTQRARRLLRLLAQ